MSEENTLADTEETTKPGSPVDYFGVDTTFDFMLPDGVSYVTHKVMTEGDRRKFLNKTNKDVRVAKQSGDAIIRMAPGDERYELLSVAIVGWNLTRGGQEVRFAPSELKKFLDSADPTIVDMIEADVRERNSWLRGNVTVEDIEKEIQNLTEQRDALLDAEAGKETS